MRTTHLVCYSIRDESRREAVIQACGHSGTHIHSSIFECDLSPEELAGLERELNGIIRADEDQILLVELGPAQSLPNRVITCLGKRYDAGDAPCFVA